MVDPADVVDPTEAVMGVRVECEITISGVEFPPGINQTMRLEECAHASFQERVMRGDHTLGVLPVDCRM